MNKRVRESIKTFILTVLIVLTFVQVGILWGDKQHGFPFNFLSTFITKINSSLPLDFNQAKRDFFRPFRIVVSKGYDDKRWIIDSNDELYSKLWSEGEQYLKDMLIVNPDVYPKEQWDELVAAKKSVIFEFKTNIDIEIVSWFLDIKNMHSNKPSGVHKIGISIGDGISSKVVVYILDDKELFRYVLQTKKLNATDYEQITEELNHRSNEKSYMVIVDKFRDQPIRQDLLFNLATYEEFSNIATFTPEVLAEGDISSLQGRNELARFILGSERYSYESYIGTNDEVVFVNLNNIYRLYQDGLLVYRTKALNNNTNRGDISDAFEKALEFIYKYDRDHNISGVEIVMSGYEQNKDTYRFTFDYYIKGLPIFIQYESSGEIDIKHAITIEANGSGVVSAVWLIKSFIETQRYNNYSIDLTEAVNPVFNQNKKINGFYINDVSVSYEIKSENMSMSEIEPVWIIETNNKFEKYVVIPMRKR